MKSWISIIIGVLIIALGSYIFVTIWDIGLILAISIFAAGFVATHLSDEKKSRNGLYSGIIFLLVTIITNLVPFNAHILTVYSISILAIILLAPSFMGGFIAKYLHLYQEQKKDLKTQENDNRIQNQPRVISKNKLKDYFKDSDNIIFLSSAFLFVITLFTYFYWKLNTLTVILVITLFIMGLYEILKGYKII